jgi:HSP20 family molecular chaperone IbpA
MNRIIDDMLDIVVQSVGSKNLLYKKNNTDEGAEWIIELPGLTEKDIDVRYEDDTLTVNATYNTEVRKGKYSVQEVIHNIDTIDAVLKDGILTVTAKKSEQAKARKVEIKKE